MLKLLALKWAHCSAISDRNARSSRHFLATNGGRRPSTVINGGALKLQLVSSVELAIELLVIEPAHKSGQWRVLEGWQA
jgi:hypothetical protein